MYKLNFIILLFFLISCVSDVKTNIPNRCINIFEAKEKKVFICSYSSNKSEFYFNGIKIKIDDSWIENVWEYKNKDLDISKSDFNNFIVTFNNEFNFENTVIKIDGNINAIGISRHCIFKYLNKNEIIKDTIELELLSKKDTVSIIFIKNLAKSPDFAK